MTYLNDDQIRAAMRASMRRHPAGKHRGHLTDRGKAVIYGSILLLCVLAMGWLDAHPL